MGSSQPTAHTGLQQICSLPQWLQQGQVLRRWGKKSAMSFEKKKKKKDESLNFMGFFFFFHMETATGQCSNAGGELSPNFSCLLPHHLGSTHQLRWKLLTLFSPSRVRSPFCLPFKIHIQFPIRFPLVLDSPRMNQELLNMHT